MSCFRAQAIRERTTTWRRFRQRGARGRLEAIGMADQTKISVLRLGGQERLFGFRDRNVFHVVWWDPQHQIWPSLKKNT